MKYLPGAVIYLAFNSHQADGTPIALLGTPAAAVYRDGSLTENTTGLTLTVNFDGRVGYNVLTIDTNADPAFYQSEGQYRVVMTAGTVDSKSVVGSQVASFSLQNADPVIAGLVEWTYTVTQPAPNQTVPIEGVEVWVSSDAAGDVRMRGSGVTDGLGRVKFWLMPTAAGEKVYVWRRHPNWVFANPDEEEVP